MSNLNDKRYQDFDIGDYVYFTRKFNAKDHKSFSQLSGDYNPLHFDKEYAKNSKFGEIILPMHLTTMPLSAIAGMMLPGHRSLYLSTNIKSIKPAHYDKDITYSAKIIDKNDPHSLLIIRVLVFDGLDVLLDAHMTVQVRNDVNAIMAPDYKKTTLINKNDKPTAFITGASGDIGQSVAVRLSENGWNVILHYSTDTKKIKEIESICMANGSEVETIKANLENEDELNKVISILKKRTDIVDMIHAACPKIDSPLNKLMTVNYVALQKMAETVLPIMLLRQYGRVTYIGSTATRYLIKGWENYTASKSAASNYVYQLNTLYEQYGVNFRVVAPGYVKTKFSEQYRTNETPAILPEHLAEEIVSGLRGAWSNSANHIQVEHHGTQIGNFNFHKIREFADDVQAKEEALGVESVNHDNYKFDIEIEKLIREFIKIDPNIDMENLGVDQISGWDSLRHIELIVYLEKELNIKFKSHEIEKTKAYTELVSLIKSKINNN